MENDENGCPTLIGAAANFACKRHNSISAGDHLILVGEITAFEVGDKAGLGYASGGYFSLALERRAANIAEAGRPVHVGAIIEHDGKVLLQESDGRWQPVRIAATESRGSLLALRRYLTNAAIDAHFGPVYSIVEDPVNGEYSTYYRAEASNATDGSIGTYVEVDRLTRISYTTRFIAEMMNRYVEERCARVANLYDAAEGDRVS